MKHLLRGLFIAVLFICCNFQLVLAQPMQELPVDKNVRIGKLDNGLTYYIRHNALPEKRVEFYIAQKVGSSNRAACVFPVPEIPLNTTLATDAISMAQQITYTEGTDSVMSAASLV